MEDDNYMEYIDDEEMDSSDDDDCTYTNCYSCGVLWQPYYGKLTVKDDEVIYTCINCLEKKLVGIKKKKGNKNV